MAAEHEDGRRLLAVEADAPTPPARQTVARQIDPVFQARSALGPRSARDRRLVDDQHQPVAVKRARRGSPPRSRSSDVEGFRGLLSRPKLSTSKAFASVPKPLLSRRAT